MTLELIDYIGIFAVMMIALLIQVAVIAWIVKRTIAKFNPLGGLTNFPGISSGGSGGVPQKTSNTSMEDIDIESSSPRDDLEERLSEDDEDG